MISINDKHQCCGCSACAQACPKQCISMQEDEEGFLYPHVNGASCIDCGLCEKVCPCLNISEAHDPLKVFAAVNPNDEVRMQSSSGGVFTMLAEAVINKGGVVFGARFDADWNVRHDYTESLEGLAPFRGSKYVQSVIGDSYLKAKAFLEEGRQVLFSGTPCQIAGLNHFLRKEYDNLLAVECVCHSVPSPGVWRSYLKELVNAKGNTLMGIQSVNQRDKCSGWKGYSCSISFKNGKKSISKKDDNLWMRGFLVGLYTRPSCSNCPSKALHSYADIGLGDLWGITQLAPEIDDDKGVNIVLIHTEKGKKALSDSLVQFAKSFSLSDVACQNLAIIKSFTINEKRNSFYDSLNKGLPVIQVIDKNTRPPMKCRIRAILSHIKQKVLTI